MNTIQTGKLWWSTVPRFDSLRVSRASECARVSEGARGSEGVGASIVATAACAFGAAASNVTHFAALVALLTSVPARLARLSAITRLQQRQDNEGGEVRIW
jgi:hypothetical protein